MSSPAPARARGPRAKPLPRAERRHGPRGPLLIDGRLPPRHVLACRHQCHGRSPWGLWTWDPSNPAMRRRVEYECRSWRCPTCARREARVLFARIREAFEGIAADELVFLTLTIDRLGTYSGKRWTDLREAYRALQRMSQALKRRLETLCRRRGWTPIANRYVAVVEAHRSGWPHMHWVLHAPELARELAERQRSADIARVGHREAILCAGELRDAVTRSGWGVQSTAEAVRSADAMAGYVSKLAGEQDSTHGELAKMVQLPHEAPPRTRRLRSGRGFLPPRWHSGRTGALVHTRRDSQTGAAIVVPLNPPVWHPERGETAEQYRARCEQSADVCYAETDYQEELAAREATNARLRRAGWAHMALAPPSGTWIDHRTRDGPPSSGHGGPSG